MSLTRLLDAVGAGRRAAASDCRCSHQARAHEHYRRGTDCALCGCRRFRRGAVTTGSSTVTAGPAGPATPVVPAASAPLPALTGAASREQPGAA